LVLANAETESDVKNNAATASGAKTRLNVRELLTLFPPGIASGLALRALSEFFKNSLLITTVNPHPPLFCGLPVDKGGGIAHNWGHKVSPWEES
jgi:hypothetical protein